MSGWLLWWKGHFGCRAALSMRSSGWNPTKGKIQRGSGCWGRVNGRHAAAARRPLRCCLRAHSCCPAHPQKASLPSVRVQIMFVPNTADDPARRKPDITKAKTILGWSPKVRPARCAHATLKLRAQELRCAPGAWPASCMLLGWTGVPVARAPAVQ